MADRLAAMGGTLAVRSQIGQGTVVTGRVPAASPADTTSTIERWLNAAVCVHEAELKSSGVTSTRIYTCVHPLD
jgi:hypothetical protein